MENERQRRRHAADRLHSFWSLFALGVGLFVVSCSKEPDFGPDIDRMAPIALDAGLAAAEKTKAAIEGDKFPASAPAFFLTAYAGTAAPSDWSASYFSDKPVNSNSSGVLSWPPDGTQYWPADSRQKLYFYAYAPAASVAGGTVGEAPVVSYTITGQEDILWARNVDGTGKPSDIAQASPVSLGFDHKLMQVKFRVVKDASFADDGVVTAIRITGVRTAAALNLESGLLSFSGDATGMLTAYSDVQGVALSESGADIPGYVMFEPQASFTCEVVAGSTTYKRVQVTLSGPQAGQAGTSHQVTLTFRQGGIVPGATVAEWSDGSDQDNKGEYPFVADDIIVTRNAFGQADPAKYPTHERWTVTPTHAEHEWDANTSGRNTVGVSFKVGKRDAGTDRFSNASALCASYGEEGDENGSWRLPTARELMTIYKMSSRLSSGPIVGYYWSATSGREVGSDAGIAVDCDAGRSEIKEGGNSYNVRCVRDMGRSYPYVLDGNAIVVRDARGGADAVTYPLHGAWTTTPRHAEENEAQNRSGRNTVSTRFRVAKGNAKKQDGSDGEMNWYRSKGIWHVEWNPYNYNTCASYSEEDDQSDKGLWRQPTIRELKLIHDLREQFLSMTFSDEVFWSATENGAKAYSMNFQSHTVSLTEKTIFASVRCVRDDGAELRYPYVQGNAIVLDDGMGAADPEVYPTHEIWQETVVHNESEPLANTSGYNTVPASKMVVASKDAGTSVVWDEAVTLCSSYNESAETPGTWRLPTMRELKLIYDRNNELTHRLVTQNYWSATTDVSDDDVWRINFGNGGLLWRSKKWERLYVRCVRDVGAEVSGIVIRPSE